MNVPKRTWIFCLLAVFLGALLLRAWDLGASGIQNDEQVWHERSVRFVDSLLGPLGPQEVRAPIVFWPREHVNLMDNPLSISVWPFSAKMPAPHPGVPMGLLVGLSIIFTAEDASSASLDLFPLDVAGRLPGVLLGSLAPVLLALLVAPFIGRRAAIFAAIVFAVEPAVLGWSRLARLDYSQAFFVMLTVLCYAQAVALRRKGLAVAGGLGFAAGMATTPYILVAALPVLAARLLLSPNDLRSGLKRPLHFLDGIDVRFVLAALIGIYLFYVNIWVNPVLGVQEIVERVLSTPHASGEPEGSRMPVSHLFYLVRAPQRVLPTTLLLAALGICLAFQDRAQRRFGIVCLAWLVGAVLLLSLPPGRKAFRNFLVVMPVLCIFAGIGAALLSDTLARLTARWRSQVVSAGLIVVGVLACIAWSPYPQVFLWPGVPDPQEAELKELIAEGEGVREAIDYIRSQGGEDSRVVMWTGVNNAMYYFPREQLSGTRPDGFEAYSWLVVLPKLAFAAPAGGVHALWLAQHQPEHIVYKNQVELVRIYRLPSS